MTQADEIDTDGYLMKVNLSYMKMVASNLKLAEGFGQEDFHDGRQGEECPGFLTCQWFFVVAKAEDSGWFGYSPEFMDLDVGDPGVLHCGVGQVAPDQALG